MKKLFTHSILLLVAISIFSCKIADPEPVDPRKAFFGTYNVEQENVYTGRITTYTIKIRASEDDEDLLLIENFYNAARTISAEFSGSVIRIPKQPSGFNIFEGRGTQDEEGIEFSFIVNDIDENSTFYEENIAYATKR